MLCITGYYGDWMLVADVANDDDIDGRIFSSS